MLQKKNCTYILKGACAISMSLVIIFYFSIPVMLIKTKKGKINIKVNENTFYLKPGNYKSNKKRWCCTQNKYCKAFLHAVDNKIVAIYNKHNHEKK